jgi:integrase
MATTTIHKRIQFARQFMHDAVDWKIIKENPFCKVKTQKSSVKVNEFVPREVVDKLMKKANPVWQVILGLSRYGGLRTPSETLSLRWDDIDWEMNQMNIPKPKVEHHAGRGFVAARSFRNCVRSSTKRSRSSETRANMWSPHRSTAPQPTRRWAGKMQT